MTKNIATEFLRESNAIEGVYSDDALWDSKLAWSYAINNKDLINLEYILEIHRLLINNLNPKIAGRIRDRLVTVGGQLCPAPVSLLPLINKWLKRFSSPTTEEEIKLAHVEFEKIHPFEDGNGRTGRIIYNVHRINAGFPIHIIYADDRQEYYKWFYQPSISDII